LRQVKFYIDEEHYEELKKLAQEQGLTVPGYVKRLVLKHLGEIEGGVEENVEYLLQRQEQMRKELGRIGLDLIKLQKRVEYLERYIRREASTKT
jgi:predicted DNA-binding protein